MKKNNLLLLFLITIGIITTSSLAYGQCSSVGGKTPIAIKGELIGHLDIKYVVVQSSYPGGAIELSKFCLLYTSPSPRDATLSRMPSSA